MKVHPAPRKRNITIHYNINRGLAEAEPLIGRQKKLRRLPHIFSKVLELPFESDADVVVQENDDEFTFVVAADDLGEDVRAQAIQIHPGVTKVVIQDGVEVAERELLSLDDLELNRWRFRLPSCTRPELAVAIYSDGELVVTVPKGGEEEEEDGEAWRRGGNGDVNGVDVGRLVPVQ